SLISDNHNNLWIGTSTGLFKKDSGLSVIKKVTGGDSFGSRVLSLPIVSLVVGKDGVAVIGTKNGLFRYNISTNRVDQLEVDNELFAKGFITNVQLDRLNNVWVTAHNSVFMLGKNGQARHYGIDEGMRSQGIPTGAALVTSDGKLFVGGGNTFCVSTSLELKSGVNVRPEVVLSNVTLLFDDSVEKRYYDVLSPFILKEREGFSLKFKFGLNDFISSKNNRFKYRVNGGDGEYIDLKLANTLTLSDLESGEYILEVKGSFDGATWSDEPLLLKFVVTPPLHKSGFAIAFYILAILFLGQLVYNVGFRYLRQIRKSLTEEKNSKKLFEAQSVKLALSNKSLTDSIDYAKRIQVALLPSIAEIRRLIPKSFLYYRPKDIVSGDFYAVFEVKGKVVVVAADCTGHGVPGAFMSMIGYDMLKNIITVQDVVDPGQILQLMNNGVVSMLRHSSGYEFGHELDVNDGMDMSVCVIDKEKKQLYFSGAVNPLYLIRDNEILIYKGSRFAVGQADVDGENLFPTEVIDLQSDDVCYLFSDGYVDQFGGSEGKKFKYRRFRHLLLRIHRLGHASQSSNVESMMNDWMNSGGVRYPQVDDMLLIGFSPLGID
nr:SpoIIE family protein phosphatase [Breznakibacter sp.]